MTKLIVAFRNFANAPKYEIKDYLDYIYQVQHEVSVHAELPKVCSSNTPALNDTSWVKRT